MSARVFFPHSSKTDSDIFKMPEHFINDLFHKTLNKLIDRNVDSSDVNYILNLTLDTNSCLHNIPDLTPYKKALSFEYQ